jgi:hypothetical protein
MHRAAAERIREQDFPAAEQAPDREQGIRGLSDPAALAETGADSLPQDGKLNAGTKNRFGGNQKLDPAVTEPSWARHGELVPLRNGYGNETAPNTEHTEQKMYPTMENTTGGGDWSRVAKPVAGRDNGLKPG